MEVLRIQNLKYDKNFQLIIVFLINTLLFVRMEQKSKTEDSHSNVFLREGVHREKQ